MQYYIRLLLRRGARLLLETDEGGRAELSLLVGDVILLGGMDDKTAIRLLLRRGVRLLLENNEGGRAELSLLVGDVILLGGMDDKTADSIRRKGRKQNASREVGNPMAQE